MSQALQKPNSLLKLLPAVLLAAVLLYFALRGVEWSKVGHTIAGADWKYLAMGAVTGALSSLFRSVRWRILLNAALPDAPLSVITVFWATMAGYFGNLVLPARAGELVRTFLISSRSGLSKTYVLTTALGERVMDAISLILLSALALLSVDEKPAWITGVARSLAAIAIVAALGVALLPHLHQFIAMIVRKLPGRDKLLTLLDQIILGLRAFHNPARFAGFAALTLAIWFTDTCGAMLTARALGLSLTFPMALLFLSALGLSSALPSTPGYVGIYQFVAVTVLGPFGIAKDAAVAYVLVIQALGAVMVIGFGAIGLVRLGGSLAQFRKMSE